MRVGFYRGAMYVEVEGEQIDAKPIELGDTMLHPGQYINKMGHVKRTSFEMQDGWYLKYVGRLDEYLLFDTNCDSDDQYYYAFIYIDKNTLLIQGETGFRDVKIKTLEVFEDVKQKYVVRQMNIMHFMCNVD